MKKVFLFLILLLTLSITIHAQSDSTLKKLTLHGIVKNEKNKPISNASVIVEGEEIGAATDSLGVFKIDAKPNSVLIINAQSYESARQLVDGKDLLITLVLVKTSETKSTGYTNELFNQQSTSNSFLDFSKAEGSRLYGGSALSIFSHKENTVGSRYLFNEWVNGKVLNKEGGIISNNSYLFNYDKISKNFLATLDKQKIIEVNTETIKSFVLTNNDSVTVFEKLPIINDQIFFIELVKNEGKYSLYKSIISKFYKADYTTNGIFESGKNYDSFVDQYEYYIIYPGGKEFKKLELKKKSLKEALVKEDKKVKQYFSKDEEGVVNESFLKGLITFLNQ